MYKHGDDFFFHSLVKVRYVLLQHNYNDNYIKAIPGQFRPLEISIKYYVIFFMQLSVIVDWNVSCGNCLWWMSLELTSHTLTLFQLMACAVRKQTIIWANVVTELYRHIWFLGPNELQSTYSAWSMDISQVQACIGRTQMSYALSSHRIGMSIYIFIKQLLSCACHDICISINLSISLGVYL